MTSVPDLVVEVAFTTDPTSSTPAWVDISSYARAFSTHRGRNTELDRIEAGTATVLLSNTAAIFDPNNSSSPYYGYLKPMRRIRLSAVWDQSYRNRMSANDASFETSVAGWSPNTCTLARSTAQFVDGAASMAITATGTGTMDASGITTYSVSPSTQYTALASFRAATAARTCIVRIQWLDGASAPISTSDATSVADSTSAWTAYSVTATSPSTAAYAQIHLIVGAPAGAGEVHYADAISFASGSSTTWDAGGVRVTYPVFSGMVTAWPQEYPGGFDSIVPLQCVDLFRALNLNSVSASYAPEASGTRIANVLTSCVWPSGSTFRDLDVGQSTVQATTLDGSALQHLQDIAQSEAGLFFMSRAGVATFIDRAAVLTTALDTTLTWGDGGGSEKPYLDVAFLDAEVTLWNDIDVTAPALTTQTTTDATSQASYFSRNLPISTLLTTVGEMLSRSQFALARYKQPATRVSRIDITGQNDTTQWPYILGREIGDKVRVKRRGPSGGATISQDSNVEGIDFSADATGTWKVTWNLSPTGGSTNYLVLDDPVNGLLDANLVSF